MVVMQAVPALLLVGERPGMVERGVCGRTLRCPAPRPAPGGEKLAPHATQREQVVAYGSPEAAPSEPPSARPRKFLDSPFVHLALWLRRGAAGVVGGLGAERQRLTKGLLG